MLGAIGKFVSIKVALIVATIALVPAILLYRRALKDRAKVEDEGGNS